MTVPTYQHFITDLENGIAILRINRPEVRNAMNNECWRDLRDFIDFCDHSSEVRVVIITGEGESAFISGQDIHSLQDMTYEEAAHGYSPEAIRKIETCTKPVIAAVNGLALGGGFELALCCDFRIVAEKVKFGLPESNLGLLPGLGGTQRLPRFIGIGRAKEVVMANRLINAQEAVEFGIAMKAVPREDLMKHALALAELLARKSPASLNYAKKVINASEYADPATGILLENTAFDAVLRLEDTREGINAFLEKRTPVFQGK